jgi:phage baseplate assembly protein W
MAVVEKLHQQTVNAERALKQSIDNYLHTDAGHAAHYRGHQG